MGTGSSSITSASIQDTPTLSSNTVVLLKEYHFQVEAVLPRVPGGNNFAQLFRGTYKQSPEPRVAKLIDLEKSVIEYRNRFLPRDQSAIRSLKHISLVEIYDSKLIFSSKVLLIMEHCAGGSLLDLLLERPQPLAESIARRYYRQFGDALRYMHSEGYAHRNVKCEKILLNASQTDCKLADFGFTRSCFRSNQAQPLLADFETCCASAAYVAPEVLIQESGGVKQQPYNQYLADVWSAGVVLFAMVHGGRLPFREWNLRLWIDAQRTRAFTVDKERLSVELVELIGVHLTPNPAARPSMEEILEHKWMSKNGDD